MKPWSLFTNSHVILFIIIIITIIIIIIITSLAYLHGQGPIEDTAACLNSFKTPFNLKAHEETVH
jgi:hypothetical protein